MGAAAVATGAAITAGAGALAGSAVATSGVGAVSAGSVTLYRAVAPAEATDILETGAYRIAGASAEFGKYFYPTLQQAQAFVARGWATRLTSGSFPQEALADAGIEPSAEAASTTSSRRPSSRLVLLPGTEKMEKAVTAGW